MIKDDINKIISYTNEDKKIYIINNDEIISTNIISIAIFFKENLEISIWTDVGIKIINLNDIYLTEDDVKIALKNILTEKITAISEKYNIITNEVISIE